MSELTKIEQFKLYLITYDMPLNTMMNLVTFCPEILEMYDFDQIIMISPLLDKELRAIQKSIIVPPIVYTAITLSAMKSGEGIMEHITRALASKAKVHLESELKVLVTNAIRKIERNK